MLRRFVGVGLAVFFVVGCTKDLTLPPQPPPARVPVIAGFTPHAAFSGDQLVVYVDNVEGVGNQLEFAGGYTVLADVDDAGEELRVDGGLSFVVPEGLELKGPLLLSNTEGRSEPSADEFSPLGVGHPNYGTPVAQLRFRHNPVGLVDREENVLMASSIFDLLVTDGKAFQRVPGRPIAMLRSPTPDAGLVSVAIPGRHGMFLEVDSANGAPLTRSADSDTREQFILPPLDSSTVARTIGLHSDGSWWFSSWTIENVMGTNTLMPNRRKLTPFVEVIGAAALGAQVTVIARQRHETFFSVWTVTALGQNPVWSPRRDPDCESPTGTDPLCVTPDGPVAVVPAETLGAPPVVVVSLQSGDLLKLDGAVAEPMTLISYAPITALAAGLAPGKVIFTKAIDGALFQYDLASGEPDWSVQLRGEPSVIDLSASIDEIAVGNRLDNAVDIVTASTGAWVGRIAFNLGVGSADGRQGGIVAPFSYDPDTWPNGVKPVERMDLLMRNVGLVVSLDASSLELIDHLVLKGDLVNNGVPVRLAVTHDLQTLVVHTHKIGVLEGPDGDRTERMVTSYFADPPLDVLVMEEGQVILSWFDVVRWYEWVGEPRVLQLGGELRLPTGATLQGIALDGKDVLVTWKVEELAGGFYRLDAFPTGDQSRAFKFPDGRPSEFLGMASMRDGPVAFFLKGDRPVVYDRDLLRNGGMPRSSVMSRKRIGGMSPDGRFVIWLDEGSAEPMARLVKNDGAGNMIGYSTYRLAGHAAGPACDPSGEWLYVPVPLLDQLEVVQ